MSRHHGRKPANYDGERYNAWTVIARVSPVRCIARCDCGWQGERNLFAIVRGVTRRCRACSTRYQHGWSGTAEHAAWDRARRRRGAKTWAFADFLAEVGPRPDGLRWLVPIDTTKPLGPGNAKWGRRANLAIRRSKRVGFSPFMSGVQAAIARVLASGPKFTRQIAADLRLPGRRVYESLRRLARRGFAVVSAKYRGQGGVVYWRLTSAGLARLAEYNRRHAKRVAA